MPFVTLGTGPRLYYEDRGQGQPLILLHGLLGSAADHFPQVMAWLEPRFRLLGPSLRGYGLSEPAPREFALDFYHVDARDVLAFMDALAIERAHILGYSDGGEAAMVAAGLAPERFLSVATIGAVGSFTPVLRAHVQNMYPGDWITADERARNHISHPDAFVQGWINAFKHMIDSGGDVSLSLAPRITCPALVMLGETDRLNPAELGQKWVAAAPKARLVMFPCGHAVHDECWPEFQDTYSEFLDSAINPAP